MIDSFALLTYASLAASRTHLQRLLACLNITLDSDLLLLQKKKKAIYVSYENHADK